MCKTLENNIDALIFLTLTSVQLKFMAIIIDPLNLVKKMYIPPVLYQNYERWQSKLRSRRFQVSGMAQG